MTERALGKYFVKKTNMYYDKPIYIEHGLLDTFYPVTIPSVNYKNWRAILDIKTCKECRSRHGQIYRIDEVVDPAPPCIIIAGVILCKWSQLKQVMQQKTKKMVQIIGLNILVNYRNIMLQKKTYKIWLE